MTMVVTIGLQWGDEGKGKIVDLLARQADAVGRFQGGHNAGHTICVNDETVILHLVPSGILHPRTKCYIGPGVVLSPEHLLEETETLERSGVSCEGRLFVSPLCPLLLACHRKTDVAREHHAAERAIGTTGRGIGPVYEDRAARRGLIVGDLRNADAARERLSELFAYHNFMLERYYRVEAIDSDTEIERLLDRRGRLLAMSADVSDLLMAHRARGEHVVLEGAQGAMLDIVFGTYPHVTSSHTMAAYAALGLGLPPRSVDRVLGVIKAYATRVGNGPFPTEFDKDTPEDKHISQCGKEFGATTGRARRCGWLDLEATKRMAEYNSVDVLCLTKIDVLDGLGQIRCYVGESDLDAEQGYITMPGWSEPTAGVRNYDELPGAARRYIEMIEARTQLPVGLISTGASRDDCIVRRDIL